MFVYVEDIVTTGNDDSSIDELKGYLYANFDIRDLGPLKYLLDIEIAQYKDGICLNQQKYVLELISDAGMSVCKTFDTPMEQHFKITTVNFDKSVFSIFISVLS